MEKGKRKRKTGERQNKEWRGKRKRKEEKNK